MVESGLLTESTIYIHHCHVD